MGSTKKYAVFIGRFQPVHNGHLGLIYKVLKKAENIIILVGSANTARDIKNPFTFEERKAMLYQALVQDLKVDEKNFVILPVEDSLYSENNWYSRVQYLVSSLVGNSKPALVYCKKDESTYYLDAFPQWDYLAFDLEPIGTVGGKIIGATEIREPYFRDGSICNAYLPKGVVGFMEKFKTSDTYDRLKEEHYFISRYKDSWAVAPYSPTFVTTDAVVVQSGHVLLVVRKHSPGAGLWALPGGFVQQDEAIEMATIRELKEETKLKIPFPILKSKIVATKVFDHPKRSLRGRTITHASLINLGEGSLWEVRGADDAQKAFWVPLNSVDENRDKFYEDHFHIIKTMISRI